MSYCDFVAGWGGGIAGLLVGHPLDTLKVNQQTQGIGLIKCFREISKQGYRGFYRGLSFPLVAQGAIDSMFFGAYGYTLDYLTGLEKNQGTIFSRSGTVPVAMQDSRGQPISYLNIYFAGFLAGFTHLLLSCPVEIVRIRLQTQQMQNGEERFRGPISLLRYILRTQGVRGLYQGLAALAWRDPPALGVYMLAYEMGSNKVRSWSADQNRTLSSFGLFVAGGMAGIASWGMILPIDVVKSQIQAQDPTHPDYKGALKCTQRIFREQGLKGFYRGFLSLAVRVFPVNGATLLIYDRINTLCRYFNESS